MTKRISLTFSICFSGKQCLYFNIIRAKITQTVSNFFFRHTICFSLCHVPYRADYLASRDMGRRRCYRRDHSAPVLESLLYLPFGDF
jgi:hypothetical protein